jgi:hypothetical protein
MGKYGTLVALAKQQPGSNCRQCHPLRQLRPMAACSLSMMCVMLLSCDALQNGKTMVDGLDAGNGTWLAADFATIVFRMKLLGFNAVRLPFRFTDLEAPTT